MMDKAIIGKIFNANIKALYERIGDNETEWGYHIKPSSNNGNYFYDLYGYDALILICNGERCKVAECYDASVRVINLEFSNNGGITFSKEEFDIVFGQD